MPSSGRTVLINTAVGFALAAVFVALLLWFNIAGLAHRIAAVSKGWVMLLPLWAMFGGLFTCIQIVLAGLKDDDDDDDGPRGGHRDRRLTRDPVAIHIRADQQRGDFWTRR
ncbi:MAG: hypothetical protein AAGA28_17060 [Pseudomonadota bacterium]